MNYYQVLGISRTATTDEIKQRYRQLARTHHPDVRGYRVETVREVHGPDADEQFARINEAYRVLVHEERRRSYDLTLPDRAADSAGGRAERGPGGAAAQEQPEADTVSGLLVRAQQAALRGRLSDAHQYCLEALRREPHNPQARAMLQRIQPWSVPPGGAARSFGAAAGPYGATLRARGRRPSGRRGSRLRTLVRIIGSILYTVGWAGAVLVAPAAALTSDSRAGYLPASFTLSLAVALVDAVLVGLLLGTGRLLPPVHVFFRTGHTSGRGAGPLTLGLAGLSMVQFWAALLAYLALTARKGREHRPLSVLFLAAGAIIVASSLCAGDDFVWSVGFLGNGVFPLLLAGWLIGSSGGGLADG